MYYFLLILMLILGRLIHYRFAHVGSHLLKKLNIESYKFPFKGKYKLGDFKKDLNNCDACCSCKQVEKIIRSPSLKSDSLLDLIHSDTRGKSRVPGLYHGCYFVTFTDDLSGKCEVFILKSLKEVVLSFNKYKDQKEL